jgi:hypothetical protein
MELLVPHGYWLSFSRQNRLGRLSQSQVDAAANILRTHQADYAYFPTGKVHLLIPDLVGQAMAHRLLELHPAISQYQVGAGEDPKVTNTLLEFIQTFNVLQILQPQYQRVHYLVNPAHKDRAQGIFESLEGERKASGLDTITFQMSSTTDHLSKKQVEELLTSPEQAKFVNREATVISVLKNPLTRKAIELLPDWSKRFLEDVNIYRLPEY